MEFELDPGYLAWLSGNTDTAPAEAKPYTVDAMADAVASAPAATPTAPAPKPATRGVVPTGTGYVPVVVPDFVAPKRNTDLGAIREDMTARRAQEAEALKAWLASDTAARQKMAENMEKANKASERGLGDVLSDIAGDLIAARIAALPGKHMTGANIRTGIMPNTGQIAQVVQQSNRDFRQASEAERQRKMQVARAQNELLGADRQAAMQMFTLEQQGRQGERQDQLALHGLQAQEDSQAHADAMAQWQMGVNVALQNANLLDRSEDRKAQLRMKAMEVAERQADRREQQRQKQDELKMQHGWKNLEMLQKSTMERNQDKQLTKAQEMNAETEKAANLFLQSIQENNPVAAQQAISTLLRAYSGLSATDAEYSRIQSGNISMLEQLYNKWIGNNAYNGLLPPEITHGMLNTLETAKKANNEFIKQRSGIYEQSFYDVHRKAAENFAQKPMSRAEVTTMFNPEALFTPPRMVPSLDEVKKLTPPTPPAAPGKVGDLVTSAGQGVADAAKGAGQTVVDRAKELGTSAVQAGREAVQGITGGPSAPTPRPAPAPAPAAAPPRANTADELQVQSARGVYEQIRAQNPEMSEEQALGVVQQQYPNVPVEAIVAPTSNAPVTVAPTAPTQATKPSQQYNGWDEMKARSRAGR